MKSENILLWSGLIGLILFILLPGFLKIFSFLIPAIALSTVFYQKFNWTIFLFLILLFILFPSSLLTLDSLGPNNFNFPTGGSSSNDYSNNINESFHYLDNVQFIIINLVVFVIPILGLIAGIYAIFVGKVNEGLSAIVKVIITITIVGVMLFFGTMLGWKLGLDSVAPLADQVWSILENAINGINVALKVFGVEETSLEDMEDITLLSAIETPKTLSLTIASFYPLIVSSTALIIALIHIAMKIDIKKMKPTDSDLQRFNRPNTRDFSFLVFLIVVIVTAFVSFLTYTIDSFMNYQTIGFFSIYLLITVMSCILLTFGIGSPTRITKDTPMGIVIGVSLLFLYANMFTQVQTLDLLSIEYSALTTNKILNQFLFVAPTESLLFHVFLPSLIVYYYLQKNKVFTEEEFQNKLNMLDTKIETLIISAEIHKETNNKKAYAKTMQIVNKEKQKKLRLKRTPIGISPTKLTETDFIIYLTFIFAFNVVFSILHWFKSGLTFEIFWSSGIGFLYLSSGMILTLISYRYGWLSGILAHAIHNSLTLYMIFLMGAI